TVANAGQLAIDGPSPNSQSPRDSLYTAHPIQRQVDAMRVEGFFEQVGEALGTLLRWIIDSLYGLFAFIADAGHGFLDGLSGALGMDASLLSLAALVIGLLILASAVRAFLRGV